MCGVWTPGRNQYPKFTVGINNDPAKYVVRALRGLLGENNIRNLR